MVSKVYFKKIKSYKNTANISEAAVDLLKKIKNENKFDFNKEIPIKVHFGEKGNITYIEEKNYKGVIDYLKENKVNPKYIETNVLYKGERTNTKNHIALAKKHGFVSIPIEIADGDKGDKYNLIKINGKHFKECKIGQGFNKYNQIIVFSHFKGHVMAGYGGALKQLAMGFASRAGKLDQHSNSKPVIDKSKCIKCGACLTACNENAITIDENPRIDENLCIGCAGCIAICPNGAISADFSNTSPETFYQRIAEYAHAASKGKNFIYISFALNITKYCDCKGAIMKPIASDIGVLASTDPVALDTACMDLLDKQESKEVFKGRETLRYAEENLKMGSRKYELKRI